MATSSAGRPINHVHQNTPHAARIHGAYLHGTQWLKCVTLWQHSRPYQHYPSGLLNRVKVKLSTPVSVQMLGHSKGLGPPTADLGQRPI